MTNTMIELSPDQRHIARVLFHDYPYLRGYVAAVLSGEMGAAFVDDVDHPTVGQLTLGWPHIFAGDATSRASEAMLREISPQATLIGADTTWADAFRRIWGNQLVPWKRIAFGTGDWNPKTLTALTQWLPKGYTLKQVTTSTEVEGLTRVVDWLVDRRNYPTPEDFLNRGVAFAVEFKGQIVSGCTSYAIGGGKFDLGIATLPEHQRRRLAQAVAARMVLYCIEHDIEPCWDAGNRTDARETEISAALAQKLGFTNPTPYTAYIINPDRRTSVF